MFFPDGNINSAQRSNVHFFQVIFGGTRKFGKTTNMETTCPKNIAREFFEKNEALMLQLGAKSL
jgi:hypothetical protein